MSAIRFTLRACLAVIGIASIVATGGGGDGGSTECSFFSSSCNPVVNPPGPAPTASISPSYLSVQVGERATFSATTNVTNPRYQWCRIEPRATTCVAMPQALESSYTLAAPTLADSGARFGVTVAGNEGARSSEYATLSVSPLPAVVFEDGAFDDAAWVTTTETNFEQDKPTYDVSRYPTGGNPGYYRKVTYGKPNLNGHAVTFMVNSQANYLPTSQGAIDHVDVFLDCADISLPEGWYVQLLVEQEQRKFAAGNMASKCWAANGFASVFVAGLERSAFQPVGGPGCPTGQSCPDFSASAPPMRFGLYVGAFWPPARTSGDVRLDNWIVKVWRR